VALDPALRPGSVLVPTRVIARDGTTIPVDPSWHERVCARLQRDAVIHCSPVAETAALLVESAEKRNLARLRGAIAADMESAALGSVAHECGVPFLVVRAVVDDSRTSLPAWLPDTLDELGRPRAVGLCGGLLRHPTDLARLARLARSFHAATISLRRIRSRAGAQFLLST
jgi:nucleoside phosphorylase